MLSAGFYYIVGKLKHNKMHCILFILNLSTIQNKNELVNI